MKERNKPENNTSYFDLRRVRVSRIPVGEMLRRTSRVGQDEETQRGLGNAKEVLKERGLMILDVHHSRFDVMGSGIILSEHLKFEKCVIPSSFVNLERPYLKGFYKALGENGIELYPTYRESSVVPYKERRLVKEMSPELRSSKNAKWVDRAKAVLEEPGSVVFVAVYGGMNKPKKGYIPSGIVKVLNTGSPALCTLSVYGKHYLPITTHASDNLIQFNQDSTGPEMFEKIVSEHKSIAERIGFNTGYFD